MRLDEKFIFSMSILIFIGIFYSMIMFFIRATFGEKCKKCKNRSLDWESWDNKLKEEEFTGYDWCPKCGYKQWFGLYCGVDSSSG